jgi:hypothetical protein
MQTANLDRQVPNSLRHRPGTCEDMFHPVPASGTLYDAAASSISGV